MSAPPHYNRGRVFRDPVHGLIPISNKDGFLTELIDTPEFQRLHRVRQLGVASLTFPGTDHSRFCHSLGVLHVASRILEVLRNRYPDSVLANSILLSNGKTDVRATPVAEVSKIFQTLIDHRFRLRRLYCHPSLKNEIDRIVKDVLKSSQLDLPLSP